MAFPHTLLPWRLSVTSRWHFSASSISNHLVSMENGHLLFQSLFLAVSIGGHFVRSVIKGDEPDIAFLGGATENWSGRDEIFFSPESFLGSKNIVINRTKPAITFWLWFTSTDIDVLYFITDYSGPLVTNLWPFPLFFARQQSPMSTWHCLAVLLSLSCMERPEMQWNNFSPLIDWGLIDDCICIWVKKVLWSKEHMFLVCSLLNTCFVPGTV